MYDLMTATDLTNLAYSRIEEKFNKHPEWNSLLKDFEKALDEYAVKIIRLDRMTVHCGPGDYFDLEQYVDFRNDPSHVEMDILELGKAFITLLFLLARAFQASLQSLWTRNTTTLHYLAEKS